MRDWNVVVTVNENGFNKARRALKKFGEVARTDYFNVLVMRVDDSARFLDELSRELEKDSELAESVARAVPVDRTFQFQNVEEFERTAKELVKPWVSRIAGKKFHVRMHRRGFKGKLSSQNEERFLDEFLLDEAAEAGHASKVDFGDPDLIISLETLGQSAGVSLWEKKDFSRLNRLLRLD